MANHTSMIDFIILEQMTAFAVIMQKHPGWVGKFIVLCVALNTQEALSLSINKPVFTVILSLCMYVYYLSGWFCCNQLCLACLKNIVKLIVVASSVF